MDNIQPIHYKAGEGDVIEFCSRHKINFSRGTAIKYLVRAGRKEGANEIEDLEKAAEFLRREIEYTKANETAPSCKRCGRKLMEDANPKWKCTNEKCEEYYLKPQ